MATKATNERMSSVKQTATMKGDTHMNTNRQTTTIEGDTHMNTNRQTTATKRPPMDSMRKTALVAGALYLLTFISVATLTLYGPVLKDPAYILSSGSDAGLRWGALIDVIVALPGIGTAITLYPVVRRQ